MKKKQQIIHMKEDEAFLQGINLVTGLKINYDRPVLSQTQLNALCINEKLSRRQKAIKIIKTGESLQKWSVFQNLPWYLNTPQDYEQILHYIEKYFQDFQPMLGIIADSLVVCINNVLSTHQNSNNEIKKQKKPFYLTQKTQKTLFRLSIRSFTDEKHNKFALQQWSVLFGQLFSYLSLVKSKNLKQMIEQCLQYINGSFSMNTAPQRRRIAFEMMKGLIEHSKSVKQRAKTKTSFFNTDTNANTRVVICQVIRKLLSLQPCDQQLQKFILDYFFDSSLVVRQAAFETLLSIPTLKHIEVILQSLQQQHDNRIADLLYYNLETFTTNYGDMIKTNKKYKNVMMNFINSMLKTNAELQKTTKIITILDIIYEGFFWTKDGQIKSSSGKYSFQETSFNQVFTLELVDFQNQQIFKSLLTLYKKLKSAPKSECPSYYMSTTKILSFYVQRHLLKCLKFRIYFSSSSKNLCLFLSVFTYQSQQQTTIFLSIFSKMLDDSKWPQIQYLLQQLKRLKLIQLSLQKLSALIIRLIMVCPYFLVQNVAKVVLLLIQVKRKNVQLYVMLRDKLVNSKNWMHRRNFIILYAELKAGISYDFQKILPSLNYKLLLKQKCSGVKLQFLKQILIINNSLDPQAFTEKISIKQVMNILSNDQDEDVNEKANIISQLLYFSDKDFELIQKNIRRNSVFLHEQQKMRQKEALILPKKTKTETQLGRKQSKSKTITIESRSSIKLLKNLSKQKKKDLKQITIINTDKLIKRATTVVPTKRKIQKTEEEIIRPAKMTRYSSGQMKNALKLIPLRRDSGTSASSANIKK